MSKLRKPLPRPDPVSAPFWEAAKEGRLQIQRCQACGAYVFYPREVCSECLAPELEWVYASGRGTLYSFTIARASTHPAFSDDVPYVIAIVELEEGPRITTNIIDCPEEKIRIGMALQATFPQVDDSQVLVKFRPE